MDTNDLIYKILHAKYIYRNISMAKHMTVVTPCLSTGVTIVFVKPTILQCDNKTALNTEKPSATLDQ